jgi:hypothetical protein
MNNGVNNGGTNTKKQRFQASINKFFFFFSVLGLELRAYTLSHSTSLFFVKGFYHDRVLWNCLPRASFKP